MVQQGVWFIRIVDGVRHSFPSRWYEWIMGVWAFAWAARWLFDPTDNFLSSINGQLNPAWAGLQYLFWADWVFAGFMFVFAMARLVALTVNGTFHETWYARYSPLVRGITAALCGICWLSIWLSALASNSQGGVTYWAPVVIEFITAYFVITESADVIREWRNGRTRRGT